MVAEESTMKLDIFCDFDGTITQLDTTDVVLETFALPVYRKWELLWEQGEITGRECMERQTRLIHASPETLKLVCKHIVVDPGIYELESACRKNGSSLTIVSDGIDLLMEAVLQPNGLAHIPHYSNALAWDKQSRPFLRFPFRDPNCRGGCGVCKCKLLDHARQGARTVYIGDGLSDSCVAQRAERVFAKNRLREYCLSNGLSHEPFADLSEVVRVLFGGISAEESMRNSYEHSR
jgi:2-hydroxy-3-keto-5-methylthiopentenyl-1-phosphate phosphatase